MSTALTYVHTHARTHALVHTHNTCTRTHTCTCTQTTPTHIHTTDASSLDLVEVLWRVLVGHVGRTYVQLEVRTKIFKVVIIGEVCKKQTVTGEVCNKQTVIGDYTPLVMSQSSAMAVS